MGCRLRGRGRKILGAYATQERVAHLTREMGLDRPHLVRYLADHVAVMYLGKVVEFDRVGEVFALPYHPYTEALLSAVPVLDSEA
ncbi:MAG: hypothetical protein HY359_03360 [Candidatus Rokubacteria bacterium]|nr:hypothetical protein [Candidatus Rokubacteria bacterium]